MRVMHGHAKWLVALVAGVALVGAAVGLTDGQSSAQKQEQIARAEGFASLFREVAKEALPSIVSIEVRAKAPQMTRNFQNLPFDEDSPLHEFFKEDPRFREFFKKMPQQRPQVRGQGSGFIIDESGIILTNTHVVRNAEEVKVRLQDGREFVATDIRTDPRSDVAIVRIDAPNGLPALSLGDSDAIQVGDWVLAVGSPFRFDFSVTAGIISAKGRGPGIAPRENFLQTDAAINPGNSGGPLLNIYGDVVGISTAISTNSGAYAGVGFAIPSNMAQWVAEQLIEDGEVRRAYLGVGIQKMTNDLARQFGVEVGEGAIVTQIFPDSPAANSGLQPGDVIVEFAGKKVTGPRTLQGIVERLKVGESYEVLVRRNGEQVQLSVTLEEMPEQYALAGTRTRPQTPQAPQEESFNDLGIEVKEMTPQLAEQLGFSEDIQGVVVGSVKNGSPAALAGLQAGQVIQRVGTTPVKTPEEFRKALEGKSLAEGIALLVRTQSGSQFVVVQAR